MDDGWDDDDNDDDNDDEYAGQLGVDRLIPVDDAEISDEMMRNVEGGQPSEWLIMKDVRAYLEY